MKNLWTTIRPLVLTIGFILLACLVVALIGYGINTAFNRRIIEHEAYTSYNQVHGPLGHIEYTVYKNGATDIKVYNSVGHRAVGSLLYQETNGDNYVDKIRRNGPEWRFNQLVYILLAETDSVTHEKDFEKANEMLARMREKHSF